MSEDDELISTEKMLAAFDFAGQTAGLRDEHRREKEELIRAMLPIVDLLEALEAECQELIDRGHRHVPHRSIRVIVKKALQQLASLGVVPMNAAGEPLDLTRHEVVELRRDTTVDVDCVIEEILRGYLWEGRTLRQAKVVVCRPPDPSPANQGE